RARNDPLALDLLPAIPKQSTWTKCRQTVQTVDVPRRAGDSFDRTREVAKATGDWYGSRRRTRCQAGRWIVDRYAVLRDFGCCPGSTLTLLGGGQAEPQIDENPAHHAINP